MELDIDRGGPTLISLDYNMVNKMLGKIGSFPQDILHITQ